VSSVITLHEIAADILHTKFACLLCYNLKMTEILEILDPLVQVVTGPKKYRKAPMVLIIVITLSALGVVVANYI
jgi:hypothetical protein